MLKIEILADINEAVKSITEFQKKSTESLSKMAKAGTSAFDTIGKSMVYFNQGLELAGKGFKILESAFTAGIKASIEQEESLNDLNTALKASGAYSDQASRDIQSFASELQKTSSFGDDAIIKTAALGANLAQLSGQQLKDATLAAANLASALGIDLESAMTKIAKSAVDGGQGLKRYGIQVEKGATDSLSLANAIAKVNEQFAGAAASKVNTYQGAITQANNAWGDLLEIVGGWITYNPLVIKSINIINDAIVRMQSVLGQIDGNVFNDFISNGIIKVLDGMKFLLDSINPVVDGFKFLASAASITFDIMKTGVGAISSAFIGFITTAMEGFIELFKLVPARFIPDGWLQSVNEFEEKLIALRESSFETTTGLAEETAINFATIGDSFQNTISQEKLDAIKSVLTQTQAEIAKASQANYNQLSKTNKDSLKNDKATLKERKDLQKTFYEDWKAFIFEFKSYEQSTQQERIANFKSTLGSISTLTSSNNSTLFRIGQAAAISTATIDGIAGVQKALASAPPPFNFALAALVGTAAAANVAKIVSTKPPKFADGGIVPGSSMSGDKVLARVNSGEMILNQSQQARLFDQISTGGNDSSLASAIYALGDRIANIEIVLRADDIEIARSVNRAINDGYQLARTA